MGFRAGVGGNTASGDGAVAQGPHEFFLVFGTVGFVFHFGKGRKGSPDLIRSMGEELGYGYTLVEQVTDDDGLAPFSSSSIREALRRGEVRDAAEQLGYWWTVSGKVVQGDQRGRTIGFPTVNIEMHNDGYPANGIYACRVRCAETGESWKGAGYVGDRPTFDRKGIVLEVYLLEFSGDLYGRTLIVEFNDYIRPDHRYDGVDALVAQMKADCAEIEKRLTALETDDPIRAYPLGQAQADGRF